MKMKRLLCYIAIILFLALYLIPFFLFILLSIKPKPLWGVNPPVLFFNPTSQWFTDMLHQGLWASSLINSLVCCSVAVLVSVTMAFFAAYSFSRFEIRGKSSIFFTLLTTRMGPAVGFALPFYLIYSQLGILDTHLGVIIVYILLTSTFAVWLLRGFLGSVPIALDRAAMIDGCSRLGAIRKVILPHIISSVIVTMVFCYLFVWNEYFYTMILTKTVARPYTFETSTYLGTYSIRWGLMSAASLVGMIPVLLMLLYLRRKIVKGFALGLV